MESANETADERMNSFQRAVTDLPLEGLIHLAPDAVEAVLENQHRKDFSTAIKYLREKILFERRCFICTLPIPCKHFNTVEDVG